MLMKAIAIAHRVHSDHAPLLAQWKIVGHRKGPNIWRIDNYLLLNKTVVARMHEGCEIFFQFNHTTPDKIVLWEPFKAYARGMLINQKAYLRKQQKNICSRGRFLKKYHVW